MSAVEREGLIRLSAALAARNPMVVEEAMRRCNEVCQQEQVEEVLLQSYLFLGYPLALNAFGVWRKVSGRDALPSAAEDWEGWSQRGADVCRTVYGGQYEGLRRNVRGLHPDMERWMVVEGYGKVLGRPGLDLATRELCIAALLAVLVAPRQLYSHLRGALNAGASQEAVEGALRIVGEHLGEEDHKGALSIWKDVSARWKESEEGS